MGELGERLAGKFVVIDGPDGAGKSTQLRMLAAHLGGAGVDVTVTRDPGGTEIGDKIRHILLDNAHTSMTIGCEILLYMASRTQLMGEVIAPAIERGACVLCDRWASSTVAYQVAEGTATAKDVLEIYEVALRGRGPDLTVILDLPADDGLRRIAGGRDRMEAKSAEFHQRVRELFLKQAAASPKTFAVVDASGTVDEVQQRLRKLLDGWEFAR